MVGGTLHHYPWYTRRLLGSLGWGMDGRGMFVNIHVSFCPSPSDLKSFTLAKTKIQKTLGFCCTVYMPEDVITFWVFGTKEYARKNPNLNGKWCACATFDRSAHYVAGRGVIPLNTYHVTKNPYWSSVFGKKPVKFRQFQKITLRRWVFRFGFFGVFRGSCLATFECWFGFFCKCKRHRGCHHRSGV